MKKIVKIHEAKTHLSRLLEETRAGWEIVVAKGNTPVARLVPVRRETRRPLGFVAGRLTAAFFKPLPRQELAAWQ